MPVRSCAKSYEWAKQQRAEESCIVCGNHSQREKDVFEILLKGKQPLILVLPRGLKKRWSKVWLNNIDIGRLLIISPFRRDVSRITRDTAVVKNQTIIEISDNIVIGFKTQSGQLDKILSGVKHQSI